MENKQQVGKRSLYSSPKVDVRTLLVSDVVATSGDNWGNYTSGKFDYWKGATGNE